MSGFLSSVAITLVFVLFLSLFRGNMGGSFLPFSVTVSVFLLGISLAALQPILVFMSSIAKQYSEDAAEYLMILFKAVGISLTASFASDLCRDAGEQTIATRVELLGKCEILAISLPLLARISELVLNMLEGV